jgi:hypothetical protein
LASERPTAEILEGKKPGELPVQSPIKYALTNNLINLKAASC